VVQQLPAHHGVDPVGADQRVDPDVVVTVEPDAHPVGVLLESGARRT